MTHTQDPIRCYHLGPERIWVQRQCIPQISSITGASPSDCLMSYPGHSLSFMYNVRDKLYIGISSTKWKIRYANHKYSFSHEHLKHQIALSKHFWNLKNKGLTPEIQWFILKKSNTLNCFDRRYNLCLEQKIQIMIYPDSEKLLNKRCELIARCRHRNKFKL